MDTTKKFKAFIGKCNNKACKKALRFDVEYVTKMQRRCYVPGNAATAYEVPVRRFVVNGREVTADYVARRCPHCNAGDIIAKPMHGTMNADKKCDARCTNATGHNCECQCGGRNHGAAHQG